VGGSNDRGGAGGAGAGGAAGSSVTADASGDTYPVPDAAGDVARDAGYLPSCPAWPAATTTEMVSATIRVSGTFDGGFKRFVGTGPLGTGTQDENLPPMFQVAPGSVLKNVILGAPAADGVHCGGTCLLQNVWWEDVGEDAATLEGGSATQVMTVDCGGAKKATDKVFQHNGAGTMIIHNFFADTFGKLYRSCGNCSGQYTRHAELDMITATGGGALAGVNETYMDTARFKNIYVGSGITICERWEANNTGAEPRVVGSGADGKFCIYQASDIHRL
jgi:pectate lyase